MKQISRLSCLKNILFGVLSFLVLQPVPFLYSARPAEVQSPVPREVEKLKERQALLNKKMRERIEEVEREYPVLIERNKMAFERIKASQGVMSKTLEEFSSGDISAAYESQADFFSEMASIFVEGINFIKDTDKEKTPPIGTFLKKEGNQVRFPRERKMSLGKKPFYESENFEEADLITHAVKENIAERAEEQSHMEAVEHQLERAFPSRPESETLESLMGSHPEGSDTEGTEGSELTSDAMIKTVTGKSPDGGYRSGAGGDSRMDGDGSDDQTEDMSEIPAMKGSEGSQALAGEGPVKKKLELTGVIMNTSGSEAGPAAGEGGGASGGGADPLDNSEGGAAELDRGFTSAEMSSAEGASGSQPSSTGNGGTGGGFAGSSGGNETDAPRSGAGISGTSSTAAGAAELDRNFSSAQMRTAEETSGSESAPAGNAGTSGGFSGSAKDKETDMPQTAAETGTGTSGISAAAGGGAAPGNNFSSAETSSAAGSSGLESAPAGNAGTSGGLTGSSKDEDAPPKTAAEANAKTSGTAASAESAAEVSAGGPSESGRHLKGPEPFSQNDPSAGTDAAMGLSGGGIIGGAIETFSAAIQTMSLGAEGGNVKSDEAFLSPLLAGGIGGAAGNGAAVPLSGSGPASFAGGAQGGAQGGGADNDLQEGDKDSPSFFQGAEGDEKGFDVSSAETENDPSGNAEAVFFESKDPSAAAQKKGQARGHSAGAEKGGNGSLMTHGNVQSGEMGAGLSDSDIFAAAGQGQDAGNESGETGSAFQNPGGGYRQEPHASDVPPMSQSSPPAGEEDSLGSAAGGETGTAEGLSLEAMQEALLDITPSKGAGPASDSGHDFAGNSSYKDSKADGSSSGEGKAISPAAVPPAAKGPSDAESEGIRGSSSGTGDLSFAEAGAAAAEAGSAGFSSGISASTSGGGRFNGAAMGDSGKQGGSFQKGDAAQAEPAVSAEALFSGVSSGESSGQSGSSAAEAQTGNLEKTSSSSVNGTDKGSEAGLENGANLSPPPSASGTAFAGRGAQENFSPPERPALSEAEELRMGDSAAGVTSAQTAERMEALLHALEQADSAGEAREGGGIGTSLEDKLTESKTSGVMEAAFAEGDGTGSGGTGAGTGGGGSGYEEQPIPSASGLQQTGKPQGESVSGTSPSGSGGSASLSSASGASAAEQAGSGGISGKEEGLSPKALQNAETKDSQNALKAETADPSLTESRAQSQQQVQPVEQTNDREVLTFAEPKSDYGQSRDRQSASASQSQEALEQELLDEDVSESDQVEDVLDETDTVTAIREWILQERFLLLELEKFKPVRQPNRQNPPWEYYVMRQKQLISKLKQIRRRIEFIGTKDEFFIELRQLSEIANRFLDLLNRGEYTNYQAAGKAYDALLLELESIEPAAPEPAADHLAHRSSGAEAVPDAYKPVVAQYFKSLSEG